MQVITTEDLKIKRIKIPLITGIYDPLSGMRDGTVTSQAPIVVNGINLNVFDLSSVRLCLVSALNADLVTDVRDVYRYSSGLVIVSLPVLSPGEYFPAMKIMKENEETSIYIFPVSWIVVSGR